MDWTQGMLMAALLVLCGLWLRAQRWSFAAQRPQDYDGAAQSFDLRTHMRGKMICDGVIFGPLGRVQSRFTATMEARWSGARCIMTEDFIFDSGARQHREWQLELLEDGQILAQAEDVIGQGRGQQRGDAVQLRYRLRLPSDAGGYVLNTVDWMYLVPGGGIVNRSEFRKLGVPVGGLIATMRQQSSSDA